MKLHYLLVTRDGGYAGYLATMIQVEDGRAPVCVETAWLHHLSNLPRGETPRALYTDLDAAKETLAHHVNCPVIVVCVPRTEDQEPMFPLPDAWLDGPESIPPALALEMAALWTVVAPKVLRACVPLPTVYEMLQ